jgi:hypothetical protein
MQSPAMIEEWSMGWGDAVAERQPEDVARA